MDTEVSINIVEDNKTESSIDIPESSTNKTESSTNTTESSTNTTESSTNTTERFSNTTNDFTNITESSTHKIGSFTNKTKSFSNTTNDFINITESSTHKIGSSTNKIESSTNTTNDFTNITDNSTNKTESSTNPSHDSTNISEILNGSFDMIRERISHIVQGEKKDEELLKQDDNGLDIMHHTIIQNNCEVGHYLMKKYSHVFFTPIIQYTCNNYIHLACKLGNNNIWLILEKIGLKHCLLNRSSVCYPSPCKHRKCNCYEGTQNPGTQDTGTKDTEIQVNVTKDTETQVTVTKDTETQVTVTKGTETQATLTQTTATQNTEIRDPIETQNERLLSVDFAALYGHIRLVELILTFYTQHSRFTPKQSRNMLFRAVNFGSFDALELLIHHKTYANEEISDALYLATQKRDAKCMEVLLSLKVPATQMRFNMNLYHLLCLVSTQPEIHTGLTDLTNYQSSLAECFKVLIKHNHDVNSRVPDRTYPLYSLICAMLSKILNDDSKDLTSIIQDGLQCLEILLKAGANPNFNEIAAAAYSNEETLIISGRLAFPSALVCVVYKIYDQVINNMMNDALKCPGNDSAQDQIDQFLVDVFEVLLQYGAKLHIPDCDPHVELLTDPLGLIMMTLLVCDKANPANECFINCHFIKPLSQLLELVLVNGGNLEKMIDPQCAASIDVSTLSVSLSHSTCIGSELSTGCNRGKQNDQSQAQNKKDQSLENSLDNEKEDASLEENDKLQKENDQHLKGSNGWASNSNGAKTTPGEEIIDLSCDKIPKEAHTCNMLEGAVLNGQHTLVNSLLFNSEFHSFLISLISSSRYFTTLELINNEFDLKYQANPQYDSIVSMLNALQQTPRSLLHMTKLKVWECVGKNKHNLNKLEEIPTRLKDSVLEMFKFKYLDELR